MDSYPLQVHEYYHPPIPDTEEKECVAGIFPNELPPYEMS